MRLAAVIAVFAFATIAPQHGLAADDKAPPQVQVPSIRNPVDKSYRHMVEGMDVFDTNHFLAPQATLRFQLLPRQPDVDMGGIVLKVVADSLAINIALAADNSFALERNQQALAEDASVIPNRKANSMTWRAMVRSPGLAAHTRRLGDSRLECMVGITSGLLSYEPKTAEERQELLRLSKYGCNWTRSTYLLFAERPLFSVTMRDGDRSDTLAFDKLYAGGMARDTAFMDGCDCQSLQDRTYVLPMDDTSWSDDTIVAFEYMDDVPAQAAILPVPAAQRDTQQDNRIEVGVSTRADVLAATGETHHLRFNSGYEVWLFKAKPDQPPPAPGKTGLEVEVVLLFDPAGKLKKLRRSQVVAVNQAALPPAALPPRDK